MPDRLRFAFATPADEAELRGLLRDNPMRGAITVGFTHEPSYFRGTGLAGAADRTLIARENGRLVAAGRCTTRPGWLNGEVRRTAYLGELRLDTSVQGRWDILRGGYRFFAAAYAQDPADFCFTSIVADNTRALRLFERCGKGLPAYRFIGGYVTQVMSAVPGPLSADYRVTTGTEVSAADLAAFLNTVGQSHQLAAWWSPEILGNLSAHGLRREDFVTLWRGNELVACAGVWNQQDFRQVRIHGYHPLLRAVRPLHNLLARLTGRLRLPPAGAVLNQALLTPFACHSAHAESARSVLLQAARRAAAHRGLDYVALGGPANDPWFRRLPGRLYESRLYRVDWPDVPPPVSALDARPCLPEIGLL